MDRLHIQSTDKTPEIKLDFQSGDIVITGRSLITNCPDFYNELIGSIDLYCSNPAEITIAHIQLDYIGESSSISLLEIFKKLESIHRKKSDVSINWYYTYEDKEMRETGEDYEHILNLPFRLVELADEV